MNSRSTEKCFETIDWDLGYFMGEYIVTHYLPRISTDCVAGKNVYQVTEEEAKEHDRLDNIWLDLAYKEDRAKIKSLEYNKAWNEYRRYANNLYQKYLPSVLECYLPQINLDKVNLECLKKGISYALWDSDMSHYDCDINKIEIINDHEIMRFTIVKLQYHSDFRPLPEE
jgi:hypothetical protein